MNYKNIEICKDGPIGLIKVNRPEVRNALNIETIDEISNALKKWEDEEEIKVIIFTGKGDKSFVSGADIEQLENRTPIDGLEGVFSKLCQQIERSSKVTIAAINGFALGGGCELAISCDIRIAGESARIGLPELNLSIIPGGGGTQRLSRIIGKGRAMDLILTGKILTAAESERMGLISEVVPDEELWEAVLRKVSNIIDKGPISIRLAKLVINEGFNMDMDAAITLEKLAQSILLGTEDKKEGTRAFLEKRKPQFKGF